MRWYLCFSFGCLKSTFLHLTLYFWLVILKTDGLWVAASSMAAVLSYHPSLAFGAPAPKPAGPMHAAHSLAFMCFPGGLWQPLLSGISYQGCRHPSWLER